MKSEGKKDQEGIFFLHKKSTCVHPSQYWRQARSLFFPNDHHHQHLMTTTTSTGGEDWPLSSAVCFLVCTLIRSFEALLQDPFSLFLMNHFQMKALAPTKDMALAGLHTTSQEDVTLGHSVTHRGCHHCHIRSPTKQLPSWWVGVPLGHP